MVQSIHLFKDAIGDRKKESGPPIVRAVAVLFLSSGRNTWHSTWTNSYSPGDFFRDGRRVRNTVERKKTRGTVFYLDIIPAIQASFGTRKFIITEINTNEPFRNLNKDVARYNLTATDLDGFLDLIQAPSELWGKSQPSRNRIILQETDEEFLDIFTYSALSKGKDKTYNPPLGKYERVITGTAWGESQWRWSRLANAGKGITSSMRWFNGAIEALAEGSERIVEHRR